MDKCLINIRPVTSQCPVNTFQLTGSLPLISAPLTSHPPDYQKCVFTPQVPLVIPQRLAVPTIPSQGQTVNTITSEGLTVRTIPVSTIPSQVLNLPTVVHNFAAPTVSSQRFPTSISSYQRSANQTLTTLPLPQSLQAEVNYRDNSMPSATPLPSANFQGMDLNSLMKDDVKLKAFANRCGLLHEFHDTVCPCLRGLLFKFIDNKQLDGFVWKCSNRLCTKQYSSRYGSWLAGCNLSLPLSIYTTVCWLKHGSVDKWAMRNRTALSNNENIRIYCYDVISQETGIITDTLMERMTQCRDVTHKYLNTTKLEEIGGTGVDVEIDLQALGSSKRGTSLYQRISKKFYVLFGVERRDPSKCFMVMMGSKKVTRIRAQHQIKMHVKPHSRLFTNNLEIFHKLPKEFVHFTKTPLNHTFSLWNELLDFFVPERQISDPDWSFLSEFVYRKRFFSYQYLSLGEKASQFFKHQKEVYSRNAALLSMAAPEVDQICLVYICFI